MDLGGGGQQNLNLKMSDTEALKCEKCGWQIFQGVSILRRVSPLVSPTSQEAMVPINTYQCTNCGWVSKKFLPAGLTAEEVNAAESGIDEAVSAEIQMAKANKEKK